MFSQHNFFILRYDVPCIIIHGMNDTHHIRALRRLIRSGLAGYQRGTSEDGAAEAVDHYRQLLRKDAERIRRARRQAEARAVTNPAGESA
jgi:hypothetical protein